MIAYIYSAVIGLSLAVTLLLWEAQPAPAPQPTGDIAPIGDLRGAPSVTADQIDAILATYNSPAVGAGRAFYESGLASGIDPAYALAFFVHESSAGANPDWAGWKSDGTTTHNVGNIICAGYPTCYGRFRDYGSWGEGIADWNRLITDEYLDGRGYTTVFQVVEVYAPEADGNVPSAYIDAVCTLVTQWRQDYAVAQPIVVGGKYPVTPTMQTSALFESQDCAVWGFQKDCQHWGVDYMAVEGTPVSAPFDMTIIALGEYPPGPTFGQYVQGTLPDGDVLYLGHLEARQPMQAGDVLPAGTLLGFTNSLQHTHAQLAPPGNTGPCAQDGSCLDFADYYRTH